MKQISTRQLIIFYFIYSFSIKFLTLPSLLAQTAQSDAWISALIGCLIELLVLFLTLLYINSSRAPRPPKPLKRILLLFALAVFAYELYILFNHTYQLLDHNLYDHIPYYLFIIPMLLLALFFCSQSTQAIFRSGEIFFIFILVGTAIAVFPALTHLTLPTPPTLNFPNIFRATFQNIIYFESSLFILVLCGEKNSFKNHAFENGRILKTILAATLLALFYVFFVFMFVNLFGNLAPLHPNAITSLTLHSSYATTTGRFDWVLLTIWLLLLLLRFGLTAFCAWQCIKKSLNPPKFKPPKKLTPIIVIALLIALLPQSLARGAQANTKTIITEIEIAHPVTFEIQAQKVSGETTELLNLSAPTLEKCFDETTSFAHLSKITFDNLSADEAINSAWFFFNRSDVNKNCRLVFTETNQEKTLEQFLKSV